MANLRETISNWFRTPRPEDVDYYDDEPETQQREEVLNPRNLSSQNSENALKDLVTSVAVSQQKQEIIPENVAKSEVTIPYWLEDEDTLRDEGVLFGLSESESSEKTEIIHKYFSHLTAELHGAIEQQNERIQELNLFIGQKTDRVEILTQRLSSPISPKTDSEHQLPRTLIGLALSIAMCVGNFYLIRESLKPAFAESSWIALGVFLAGMFSLFGRISLFHDTDSKVSWRSLLEEVGMPFASALFVFANVVQHQSWLQAIALFVFVFFLFLFAGKLFLSNITVLRNDLKIWTGTLNERRDAAGNAENWEAEILNLQGEVDELRIKKWQTLREQTASESERDRLFARRDMLIKLFESEFFLARRMKNQLTGKQLNYIKEGK
jgi:hypothetical protein